MSDYPLFAYLAVCVIFQVKFFVFASLSAPTGIGCSGNAARDPPSSRLLLALLAVARGLLALACLSSRQLVPPPQLPDSWSAAPLPPLGMRIPPLPPVVKGQEVLAIDLSSSVKRISKSDKEIDVKF